MTMIDDLIEAPISSHEEIIELMQAGEKQRHGK